MESQGDSPVGGSRSNSTEVRAAHPAVVTPRRENARLSGIDEDEDVPTLR
jgi:hypothetical protein